MCARNVHQNFQQNVSLINDQRLLEFAGDKPRACWSFPEALDRCPEVAGAYWRFLQALEQARSNLVASASELQYPQKTFQRLQKSASAPAAFSKEKYLEALKPPNSPTLAHLF